MKLAALAAVALLVASAQAFTQVKLPVALDGVAPAISNTTMNYHYNKHYAGYVSKLTDAYGNRTQPTLTQAIKSVGNPDTINATIIQKQGGGAWNHALYFTTLAAPNSAATKPAAIAPGLLAQIKKAFPTGVDGLKANMTDAAMGVFGSGWAWLCVYKNGTLGVETTANQDNPLMGTKVSKVPVCTPILGIDVWEHAYYVDRGPARKDYVDAFWTVVDWGRVSKNYASAVAGKPDQIVS